VLPVAGKEWPQIERKSKNVFNDEELLGNIFTGVSNSIIEEDKLPENMYGQ